MTTGDPFLPGARIEFAERDCVTRTFQTSVRLSLSSSSGGSNTSVGRNPMRIHHDLSEGFFFRYFREPAGDGNHGEVLPLRTARLVRLC